jgi:hypothetical protein
VTPVHISKKHIRLITVLSILFFYSATFVLATPPGSPYVPGATLDPACAPGDTNCSVTLSAAALDDGIVEIADFSATGTPSSSTYLRGDNTWATISGGSGTVTSVSVVSANGFGGSVATATSTPAITITTNVTGLLKGDGTAVSAAVAGTDYESPLTFSSPLSRSVHTISIADAAADGTTKGAATFTAADFNTSSGLVSLDYTNGQAASGSTKGFLTSADWTTFNGKQGALTLTTTGSSGAATLIGNTLNIPQYAYTFSTGLTNTSGTITANLSTGVSGGQSVVGGTGSGENLTLSSTSNATKGKIILGSASVYDEVNNRLGITQTTPTSKLHILTTGIGVTNSDANGILLQNTTAAAAGAQQESPGIVFEGRGWKTTATAASQQVKWRIKTLPVQGAANPSSYFVFENSINGGAYSNSIFFDSAGVSYANNFEGGLRTVSGTLGNFTAVTGSSILSTAISLAGSTQTSYRNLINGSTTAVIPTTNSYASLAFLGSAATIAATGTHPLFATVAIKPLTINSGAGTLTNSASLYVQDAATGASNNYAFWSAAGTNRLDGTTNLADTSINDSTPTLANAGFANCTSLTTVSNVVTCTASDRTLKTNFQDYNDGLVFIRNIQPQTYTFKEGTQYFDNNRVRLGFIAQEVETAGLANAVIPIGNGLIQVDFNAVTAAAVSAIKSLDIQVQALPVLQDQSLASRIADFLRSIAEDGIAIVDRIKTQKVQTQELCIGDDSDQVCVTKEQLRSLLAGPSSTTNGPVTQTSETVEPMSEDASPSLGEDEPIVPEPSGASTVPSIPVSETISSPAESSIQETIATPAPEPTSAENL